jgi:protein phosphatase
MPDVAGCSSVGRVRKNNEDSYLVDEAAGLYLVADGMGGAAAGEVASHMAAEAVAEAIRGSDEVSLELLAEAITSAGLRVQQAAKSNLSYSGMGTTVVVVARMGEGKYGVAHVGDSRAYLFNDGVLSRLTVDHTWVEEVGRRLGFSDTDLARHPMRHMLTMALGIEGMVRVPTSLLEPPAGSKLLLSTDGLHGPVSDETIAGIMARPEPAASIGEALVGAALEAGGPDNVTAVVVCF